MQGRARALSYVAIALLLVLATTGCNAGQRAGIGKAFGLADDAVRPLLDDFASKFGDDAADAALARVGRHVDDGVVRIGSAGADVPAEVRSAFTGVVCQTLVYFATHGSWPTAEGISDYVINEVGGALAAQYAARQVAEQALKVAGNILAEDDIDQKAATDVACAAAGFTPSG